MGKVAAALEMMRAQDPGWEERIEERLRPLSTAFRKLPELARRVEERDRAFREFAKVPEEYDRRLREAMRLMDGATE